MNKLNEQVSKPDTFIDIPKLDNKIWGNFRIGELFEVSRPMPRNKDSYVLGDTPFVASGSVNNGVMKFVSAKENEQLDMKACITVSPVDGSTFFQPIDFLGRGGAGSSILILRMNKIDFYRGEFLSRSIEQTCSKYSYGHMGNKESIVRERINLPLNNLEQPDYQYMSDFIQQKKNKLLTRYLEYLKKCLNELGDYVAITTLADKKWKSFLVPEIFTEISRGKRLKKADQKFGKVPYVSSTANNNGVDRYIYEDKNVRSFKNCISIANSGSVGKAFYEPFKFVASDHVTRLKNKNYSKWHYLFLVSVLEKQGVNFNFNREINDTRIKKMQIMLPIDNFGQPDFKYMEQYSKNMMIRKYQKYLEYLESEQKIV